MTDTGPKVSTRGRSAPPTDPRPRTGPGTDLERGDVVVELRGTEVPPEEDDTALTGIVSSAMLMHAVSALVGLGVIDALADGPLTLTDLARRLQVEEDRLLIVVRPATVAGLLRENGPDLFTLSPSGERLRADDPSGLRDLFHMCTYGDFLQAWTHLEEAIRTGRTAFELHTGRELFGYLGDNREEATIFHRAMNASAPVPALLERADLPHEGTVADLGGGEGAALATILRARPHLEGILFDLPEVVEGAAPLLRAEDVDRRCTIVGGSFFDRVPPGADVYLMTRVMQNWSDADALRILRNVREAMHDTSRLLITGHLPERERPSRYLEAMSLSMFVLYGAPLRTSERYEELFHRAGLTLRAVHRVPEGESIMDVRRAP
ncbi:methyltransferase [Nocardiopsis alba]|uniref:methyltransferase n=1 Tax=Nocardiopsis alba TaxID=53437 RepID=UPI0005A7BBB4|nr:methyltransferase [Nocardiopsis alba]